MLLAESSGVTRRPLEPELGNASGGKAKVRWSVSVGGGFLLLMKGEDVFVS